MTAGSFRATLRGLAIGVLLCAGAGSAHAQGIGDPGQGIGLQGGTPPSFSKEALDNSVKAPRKAPAALPGVAPKQSAIAPPTRIPSMMSPTDELFDAINRGDMVAVRDALGRGADLSATNELGLAPLDLAIDLGRNDICFLLLSMRTPSPVPVVKAAAQPTSSNPGTAHRATRERPQAGLTRANAVAPGQPSLPTLFAGDGGAPVPRAGFLGFGGR